jgi:hypothetical protein
MLRRFWLITIACGLAASSQAQRHLNDNPTIEYRTAAVPAYKAVDDIGKLAEKKIRVAEPLSQQPLILRLHDAPYQDVLNWIAAALHGTWIDRDHYKVLTRTNYIALSLSNGQRRARSAAVLEYIQDRQVHAIKSVLTPKLAADSILALYDPNADRTSNKYKQALLNSADTRLIDRAIEAMQPTDVATLSFPDHAVFSSAPRILQYSLKMSANDLNQVFAEQNLWTNVLKGLATKHPELVTIASKRLDILPQSRVVVVLSDPVDGLPTHWRAAVVGIGGYPRVQSEGNINFQLHPPNTIYNWPEKLGRPALSAISSEFLTALNSASPIPLSSDLDNALATPSVVDPLQLVVSDGLLHIADNKNWNMVATAPDSSLFDPAVTSLSHDTAMDGEEFMAALGNTCQMKLKDAVLIVSPRDPELAEAKRTDRLAMSTYLASLIRNGYSTNTAEALLAAAEGPSFDPALVETVAHAIKPSATPFLDVSTYALGLYGSLTPDQRKALNQGIAFGLADANPVQKDLLAGMLLGSPKRILVTKGVQNIRTNLKDPEITDLVDGPQTPGEQVTMDARLETVIRFVGTDIFGRKRDEVFSVAEAATQIRRQGPWRSMQFATARANTIKLTLRASAVTDVVHFLRDYPDGFSLLGDSTTLPPDIQKALGNVSRFLAVGTAN